MMFHMCDAQKHSRQHASMADSRQNDTWPAQPNGLHLKLARASSALCHNPIISHRARGMRNKKSVHITFSVPWTELGLSNKPYYNRTHSSAVRESSQYAPNLPHSCRSPSGYRTPTHSKRLYFWLPTSRIRVQLSFIPLFFTSSPLPYRCWCRRNYFIPDKKEK